MPVRITLTALLLALLATVATAQAGPIQGQVAAVDEGSPPREVLDRYCVTCHSDRLETADLSLVSVDLADPAAHAAVLPATTPGDRSGDWRLTPWTRWLSKRRRRYGRKWRPNCVRA